MSISNTEALTRTIDHREIFHDEMLALVRRIMSGEMSPVMMAALLMGLRVKKETIGEITAAAQVMREFATKVEVADRTHLVDIGGTGGASSHSFNISTCSMFVAAAAGARVSKHGNRGVSSKSGSADVLEALGVPIEVPVTVMERALREAGIVFMFAPLMHPAMRHVGPVRRELGIPTVMNIVGPLANPAGAGRQVVGVADAKRVPLIAGALKALGTTHALVVHGEPGLDEISPLGPTQVVEIRDGRMSEWTIEPAQFGLGDGRAEELAGGSPTDNASVVRATLSGDAPPTARAAVLLNAAAAVFVSGSEAKSFGEAVEVARRALDAGEGLAALERLRRVFASTAS